MREWTGINEANSATEQGDAYVSNARMWIMGEMRRRDGMSSFSAVSGTTLSGYYSKIGSEYIIFSTSTGTVEAVPAV